MGGPGYGPRPGLWLANGGGLGTGLALAGGTGLAKGLRHGLNRAAMHSRGIAPARATLRLSSEQQRTILTACAHMLHGNRQAFLHDLSVKLNGKPSAEQSLKRTISVRRCSGSTDEMIIAIGTVAGGQIELRPS
jgi:hypothetical protein